MEAVAIHSDLELLHQKIDYLTEQIEAQRARQREFDELRQDLIPIANHMMKLTIEELEEVGRDFALEDLLYLVKRLLRNTRMLYSLIEKLEGAMDLGNEIAPIGKQAFSNAVEALDQLERRGYFAFAQEGWNILDRIVTEFTEEDVRALGDNIVTILSTLRNMTQPEVLALANRALGAIQPQYEQTPEDISPLALLRELNDPKVRRGLARMLNLVKVLADQPSLETAN